MTEAELQELERLAGEATPVDGWADLRHMDWGDGDIEIIIPRGTHNAIAFRGSTHATPELARYIAAACNAVPKLVVRIRELEEELQVMLDLVRQVPTYE